MITPVTTKSPKTIVHTISSGIIVFIFSPLLVTLLDKT